MMNSYDIKICPICLSENLEVAFVYDEPPKGEVAFAIKDGHKYYREFLKCNFCGHFISTCSLDMNLLYKGDYAYSNYSDSAGMAKAFDKIMSLPENKSDNRRRALRVNSFALDYFSNDIKNKTLLDVGSGLGVFPAAMKELGWKCTALDPDVSAVKHITEHVDVPTICGDFLKVVDVGMFDVITFNKVLEHVIDPGSMLRKAQYYLKPNGFIYIELPDAEQAAVDGKEREEFFIDHIHVFSFLSIIILVQKAGFIPISVERLQEPSTKYTLRIFLRVNKEDKIKKSEWRFKDT